MPRVARRTRCTICGYGRPPGCCAGECGRPAWDPSLRSVPVKDLYDMRRPGRQDDHGPAARSIIARIDRALTDLPEVRPGAGPYLRRLAECGWSGGTPPPPQELLGHVVVDVAADLYREQADPPVDLLEFSEDRKSTRLNSSHGYISYAVFCLNKKRSCVAS